MSVGLSITALQDILVSNFVSSPSWNDRRWRYQWRIQVVRTSPAQTGEIQAKLVTHKNHCNNWSKIHFLSRPYSRILGGLRMLGCGGNKHLENYLFFVNGDELG